MAATIEPGAVIAGKYQVDRVLGRGGMGVVVAATHLQLDQPVAIKFMLSEALGNDDAMARFAREARASVKLKSAHVARTLDVGTLENGAPYIVMELLSGADLGAVVGANGPLPVATAADYLLQALHAVAEAHALGIVHRDLKPHNLYLTAGPDGTPCVKVLDFGIAKVEKEAGQPTLTGTNALMGSPGYMSPEQIRSSRDVDGRSDVFALGAILYELVSGRAPFVGQTIADVYIKVAMEPTPRLAVAGLPEGFEEVVRRCLEKSPDDRYQSVAELAWALAPFAGPLGSMAAERVARCLVAAASAALTPHAMAKAARPTTVGGSRGAEERAPWQGGSVDSEPMQESRWGWRSTRTRVAIAGALVLVAALGLAIATRGGGHASDTPAASDPAGAPAADAGTRAGAGPVPAAPDAGAPLVEVLAVAPDAGQKQTAATTPDTTPATPGHAKADAHRPPRAETHRPPKVEPTKPPPRVEPTKPPPRVEPKKPDPYSDF